LRSKLTIAPAFALGLALSAAPRSDAQTMKVAVADIQGALLQTKDGAKAAEQIKAKFGPKEAEFNKRQQELAAKQSQYQKASNTLSEEARASAERDIQAMTKNLQRDADDAKADFQAEEQRLLNPIMEKMRAVLNRYATENQLTMVVDISQGGQGNNVLYADASVNITAALVTAYDKAESAPAASAPASASPASAAPALTAPAPPRPPLGARPATPQPKLTPPAPSAAPK
jgi:outer membrane protein